TSEKLSPGQLALALEQAANEEDPHPDAPRTDELSEQIQKERERRRREKTVPPEPPRPSKKPFPEDLERIDNVIAVAESERACPECGGERRTCGHDTSEVLEFVPAKVFVRRDLREKVVCDACDRPHFERAAAGVRAVEGGRFGPGFVGQLLVDKFRDGLPLNRLRERFGRLGVDIPNSTLSDQVAWGAELLRPLWRALQIAVLDAEVLHLDATSLAFFEGGSKGSRKGAKKKLGTLWGYVGDTDSALYLFAPSGHASLDDDTAIGPEDFLGLREGLTVADAAGIFDKTFQREGIIECGCHMHARRYFKKAFDAGDKRAALPLQAWQALFKIEEDGRLLDPEQRLALRQERSSPLFMRLLEWAVREKDRERLSSPLGKGLGYLVRQSEPLGMFLVDGRVPMDNGIVERLHIRAALTRKNYLFAGSMRAARDTAVVYSVLGSCALCGLDPVRYLAEVIPVLARGVIQRDVHQLLPRNFA
ncbi:MAG: IS66 family transposase, partial [Myxococcota bacterium]